MLNYTELPVLCGSRQLCLVYLAALGEPFALFVHRLHGEQDMGEGGTVPPRRGWQSQLSCLWWKHSRLVILDNHF